MPHKQQYKQQQQQQSPMAGGQGSQLRQRPTMDGHQEAQLFYEFAQELGRRQQPGGQYQPKKTQ
ncbi:MAG: hypothetical protein ACOYCE_11405 [Limnochordia bacterium]|nr:hypothetical protein [Bacillota bacterium]